MAVNFIEHSNYVISHPLPSGLICEIRGEVTSPEIADLVKILGVAPEMLRILQEAEHLYSTAGLVAGGTAARTWINRVREVIAQAGGIVHGAC